MLPAPADGALHTAQSKHTGGCLCAIVGTVSTCVCLRGAHPCARAREESVVSQPPAFMPAIVNTPTHPTLFVTPSSSKLWECGYARSKVQATQDMGHPQKTRTSDVGNVWHWASSVVDILKPCTAPHHPAPLTPSAGLPVPATPDEAKKAPVVFPFSSRMREFLPRKDRKSRVVA